ncbi:hypothetical protein AYK26_02295 [Euryarchaeota archaeon SM23-78]|nr:MAG: hypothetical protein AYK26_02295 [Euryarchaeota archaeon SM23-78]
MLRRPFLLRKAQLRNGLIQKNSNKFIFLITKASAGEYQVLRNSFKTVEELETKRLLKSNI